MPAYQLTAVADDRGDVGERLDVVDQRRPAPEPGHRRVRRSGPRRARGALPIDAISAVSSPHTKAPAPTRISTWKLNVDSAMPAPRRLCRSAWPIALRRRLIGERVLGPHVDVSVLGTHRVRGEGHPLEHALRVALEHAAVHERSGVALVGIADHVLAVRTGCLGDGRPLQARSGIRRRHGRAGRCAPPRRAPRSGASTSAPWSAPGSRRGRCSRRGSRGRCARSSRGPPSAGGRRTQR